MPKAASPKTLSDLKRYFWPALATASLITNAGLIGAYYYFVHYNQFPLLQSQVEARCNEPGYSRFMNQIESRARANGLTDQQVNKNLKFAAASLCFVDYDSGKTIDLNSIKPASY